MTKTEKLKSLFPLEVEVTQKILNKAQLVSITHCIGALALTHELKRLGFSRHTSVLWGASEGNIEIVRKNEITTLCVETFRKVNMMNIKKPRKVKIKLLPD